MSAIEVPLSSGKVALISPEDAGRVLAHKWSYHGEGYACRTERVTLPDGSRVRQEILLHRFIMNAPASLDVDHEDRNGLNCQRYNMRIATRSENIANSGSRNGSFCPYKGVFYRRDRGNYRSEITVNYHKRHLGCFPTPEDAARAYDIAALAAWPKFAHLNFPEHRQIYLQSITISRLWRTLPSRLVA